MSEGEFKLTIRSANDNKTVTVSSNASIKELRKVVADAFSVTEPRVCLIYAGKILKDEETLEHHKIKDGLTLHLVIKSPQSVTSGVSSSQPASSASPRASTVSPETSNPAAGPGAATTAPNPMAGLFGSGLGGMAMGGSLAEMQTRMQQEIMRNPQMLNQLMDNPMVQNLMSNPEVMRSLMEANPQMREVMERNPEVSQVFNNPSVMRQVMEMARNPAMMQEMMRNYDRALSNLESIPGGMGHLQRIYRDIQEPLMSATAESVGGGNIFADLRNNPTGTTQQGVENTQPLPNPWQAPTTQQSTGTTGRATTAPASGNPLLFGSGLGNSPVMQSMMQQLANNPQLLQRAQEGPAMQAMMETMQQDPQFMDMAFASHPMLANNPELRERMRENFSGLVNQPALRRQLTNPRAMQAMIQVMEGMRILQEEAPDLFSSMNTQTLLGGATPRPVASIPTTDATTTPGSTTPEPAATGGVGQQADMMNMLAGMLSMMGGAEGTPSANSSNMPSIQTSEQMYASQLDQLNNMGFPDRAANLRALIATFGDVNAAIDRLLNQQPFM
jgi:ubiquilin